MVLCAYFNSNPNQAILSVQQEAKQSQWPEDGLALGSNNWDNNPFTPLNRTFKLLFVETIEIEEKIFSPMLQSL